MELVHPRYVASEVLGRGGEGVVLRVRDREAPKRALVAKVLARGVDQARLEGEFALLARLRVPGLVRAHDLARDEKSGAPFLVEDFVDGPDAIAFVASASGDRVRRLQTLLLSVASTLDGLHSAGFVHGDLKPAHVRVQGAVRVLDLGAAVAPGFTRAYAAPEVVAGGPSSVASDLYGLGATTFAAATGAPPSGSPLRAIAPWVPPSLADLVDRLLRPHPRDRFASAREVVSALAGSVPAEESAGTTLIGRDREIDLISRMIDAPGALYLVGPSGVGKSHLAREVAMRALLSGREVRQISASDPHPRLIAFLRGGVWPFEGASHRALLVIDDLDRGAPELAGAIEAFRCLSRREGPTVLATAPRAPDGAKAIEVGPLGLTELAELCRAIEVPDGEIAEAARTSEGLPGWLLASRGRIPLTRAAATLRLEGASQHARSLLAVVSLFGGRAPVATCRAIVPTAADNELFTRALLERGPSHEASLRLSSPALARELAEAFATPTLIARVSEAALREETPAATLLSLASVSESRVALLEAAADRARAAEERAIEIRALGTLGEGCDAARLRRLERLARDTADAALHERVLGWLDRSDDPGLRPLACTRKAERAGRAGDHARAEALIEEGLAAARALGDELAIAWCEATRGTLALYRAAWVEAQTALASARARLATLEGVEREELARLDHNLGVVALYRGDARAAADAFERALVTKRSLGDLPGVRASLLNLGLACTRLHDLDRAENVLGEALALARSLGEQVGRAWTLAALAELHVRRGSSREGERFVAEAEACGDAVPQAIRADLALLRAEIALLEGDAARARAAIAECDPSLRADDALVDGRARTLEARAILASLPADRRKAARAAIDAIRLARRAEMPEIEAQARSVLASARTVHTWGAMSVDDPETVIWRCVEALATAADGDAAILVARAALESSGAERAFVARTEGTRVVEAWGVDAEGFPLASATERVPQELVETASRASGPLHQKSGKGARVAIAHEGAVVIVEHRYLPHAFDRLAESTARRWATLSRFVRAPKTAVRAPAIAVQAPAPVTELHETTVVPTLESRREFPGILGQSPALRRSLAKLEAALEGELPVLVVGETGVGKELFARALHEQGPRTRAPFVAVNCAAIPDSLFEAELFGHVRGSFTGADRGRGGLAGRAKNGTLFLDEVGELPLARQATLLRVLETRKFRPVGSDEELPLDARVVTATNRDLAREVERGTFRRDLLYRLDVVTIRVPPLRERTGDIARLAQHYLGDSELAADAIEALEGYAWPGNVRELAHVMQRLSMLKLPLVERSHLPREIRSAPAAKKRSTPIRLDERGEVEQALAAEDGNITRAAARLGLTRHGLKKRMVRLGMRAARSGSDS